MEELMNQLGLSIPPFTGAPWWTTSSCSDSTENLVKKEDDGYDTTHQVDYGPSQDLNPVAKRLKRNCDEDQDDNH